MITSLIIVAVFLLLFAVAVAEIQRGFRGRDYDFFAWIVALGISGLILTIIGTQRYRIEQLTRQQDDVLLSTTLVPQDTILLEVDGRLHMFYIIKPPPCAARRVSAKDVKEEKRKEKDLQAGTLFGNEM